MGPETSNLPKPGTAVVKAVVKCIRKKSRFNLDLFGKNAVARSGLECVVMRESLLLKAMEG
jgi:hypothetical protein